MDKSSGNLQRHVVWGLFDPAVSLHPVLDQVRNQGIPDTRMEVISPLPLEISLLHKPVRVPLHRITILGGLTGIGIGVFFAAGTALFYPLVTGGKPIVSIPVVGLISFETMMLVAIVSTFIAMVIKIAFVHQSGLDRDPRIDEGVVGISIQTGEDKAKAQTIVRLLREAGAADVEIHVASEE